MDLFKLSDLEVINLDHVAGCERFTSHPEYPRDTEVVVVHLADGRKRTYAGAEGEALWAMFSDEYMPSLKELVEAAEAKRRSLHHRPDDDIPF